MNLLCCLGLMPYCWLTYCGSWIGAMVAVNGMFLHADPKKRWRTVDIVCNMGALTGVCWYSTPSRLPAALGTLIWLANHRWDSDLVHVIGVQWVLCSSLMVYYDPNFFSNLSLDDVSVGIGS